MAPPNEQNIERAKRELYDLRTEIINNVREKIDRLSIAKTPLTLTVSGQAGTPLMIAVQTPDTSFTVISEIDLAATGRSPGIDTPGPANGKSSAECVNYQMLLTRFKALNDTEYFIKHLESEDLQSDLFMPFKELTSIKKKILSILNGSRHIDPIDPPRLKKQSSEQIKPTLSLLISSQEDLHLANETAADIYFQLPNSFKNRCSELIELFTKNNKVIPWFPSVLIGEDYLAAAAAAMHCHK